jgi:FixJ family two-component response regulator
LESKAVISIVDDDASVRTAMKGLMKSLDFDVEAFDSAESFLQSDRRNSTSCLIADVQMPGMTGLELHNRLASSDKPIPTILITAYPDDRIRARALRTGVRCFLAKPFADEELLGCIRRALNSVEGSRKC